MESYTTIMERLRALNAERYGLIRKSPLTDEETKRLSEIDGEEAELEELIYKCSDDVDEDDE